MTMSSEERRKRVHQAVLMQKRAAESGARGRSFEEREGAAKRQEETEHGRRSAEEKHEASQHRPGAQGRRRKAGDREEAADRKVRAGRRPARRRRPKRRNPVFRLLPVILLLVLLLALAVFLVRGAAGLLKGNAGQDRTQTAESTAPPEATPQETTAPAYLEKLSEAEKLAAMYDYDGAISLLQSDAALASIPEVQAALSGFEETKATLVRQDILTIPHVFFHILVVDSENAFDKSKWGKQADGYNSLMTTIPEFKKMLEVLYQDGFVLVGLHDMAEMQEQADGSMKMVEKDILLPPGKKALVMSEDDVCYYEYMEGAGFASRMIVGADGRPACVYTDSEGNEQTGAYDLVPILDAFIDEHPDFSYRGAKAIIAFTGYNGILGYRTDETYDQSSPNFDSEKKANPNIEADRETARQVVKALKEDGYELASHSWGHRDMGAITLEHLKKDTDRWDSNVNQALLDGECDIIIYPKGADVGDWHAYTHDNEKFDYLWNKGFRYFCNVDAAHPYWVQKGEDSLRQGRRPLDGLALWNDIANGKNRLSDLFPDVSAIFDPARPTPVPEY